MYALSSKVQTIKVYLYSTVSIIGNEMLPQVTETKGKVMKRPYFMYLLADKMIAYC